MRITIKYLRERVSVWNEQTSVNKIRVTYSSIYGYSIYEESSGSGLYQLAVGMSAKECSRFIQGMYRGIDLYTNYGTRNSDK
jgi:hypothetical protein